MVMKSSLHDITDPARLHRKLQREIPVRLLAYVESIARTYADKNDLDFVQDLSGFRAFCPRRGVSPPPRATHRTQTAQSPSQGLLSTESAAYDHVLSLRDGNGSKQPPLIPDSHPELSRQWFAMPSTQPRDCSLSVASSVSPAIGI